MISQKNPQPEYPRFKEVTKHDGARWREITNSNGLQVITT